MLHYVALEDDVFECGVKFAQDTALRDIQDLIEKGVLIKSPQGGRSTNYVLKLAEEL